VRCPNCGNTPEVLAAELARINKAIADMSAEDLSLIAQRKKLSSQLQAAMHQRNLISHAEAERQRKAQGPRQRRFVPGRGGRPTSATRTPPSSTTRPHVPPSASSQSTGRSAHPPQGTPEAGPRPRVAPLRTPPPEASPRTAQNVLLVLGGLLLGVAAVVYAVLASGLEAAGGLIVLALVTAGMLAAAPMLIRARLISTGETLTTVGLLLLPVDGYLIRQLPPMREAPISATAFAGVVFALTSLIAFVYHRATGLNSARYGMVVAAQPVVPLLGHDMIKGPAGWALVFALLAVVDAVIARTVELSHSKPLAIGGNHPIRHPQVLEGAWSSFWLRELSWTLHGVAVAIAVAFAIAALWRPDDAADAARAGATLLLACGVGLLGALMVRTRPLPDVAAGAMALAVIAVAGRVASLAAPDRTLLVLSTALVLTGLVVRALPAAARRGPQIASTLAVAGIGAFVLGAAIRAALAPVRAGLPIWNGRSAEEFQAILARAGSDMDASLVGTIALTTLAAGLALPPSFRREAAIAGAALTGLAAPASLVLGPAATLWVLTATAVAIAAVGIGVGSVQVGGEPAQRAQPRKAAGSRTVRLADLWFGPAEPEQRGYGTGAGTPRAARAHAVAAATVGLAAIAASLTHPSSTAGVLAAITIAGMVLAIVQRMLPQPADPIAPGIPPARSVTAVIGDTCAGAAAFAAPSAVAATVVTLAPQAPPSVPLVAASLTASGTLGYVALRQVARREIGMPLAVGSGLGALVITLATFGARGADFADTLVATLLLVGAVLLGLSSSIDAGMRRADRVYDGADYAAAVVVTGAIAAVTRAASLAFPEFWLLAAALMVLATAAALRSTPADWRRGPVLGAAAAGLIVVMVAGYPALLGGLRAVTVSGGLWNGDLDRVETALSSGWQGPLSLLVLAAAAAIGLPAPRSYDAAGLCVGLATVGAPAALRWPWWSPIVVGLLIATAYAIAAAVAREPRAGYARITVAIALALYAVGAALVRPWTTAAALAMVVLVCVVVMALATAMTRITLGTQTSIVDLRSAQLERAPHLGMIGGMATVGALVAAPGAVAVLAYLWYGDRAGAREIILTATVAMILIGLAAVGLARRQIPAYLGWATVGTAVAGTAVAFGEAAGDHPTGVFAATAALLSVLAELLRTGTVAQVPSRPAARWRLPAYPAAGAFAAAILPALLAVAALWPLIVAALTRPYQGLQHIWQGVPEPTATASAAVGPSAALTALLLTAAAALAAVGFGGGANRAVARVAPVVALTLLILPYALRLSWNSAVLAGLTVFTICMLGVALTDPPTDSDSDRSLRTARIVVLLMGLIGGGAGLAGALATPGMTIFTFGGAMGVGAAAAMGGRSQIARIMGWLGAAVAGELFIMSVSLDLGMPASWTAVSVLGVGAVLIIGSALLPRFAWPQARPEGAAVEWAGQFAAVIALVLALNSPTTVAVLLAAWSAVLGIAAGRPTHTDNQRRAYFWASAGSAIGAWWLIAQNAQVAEPEAYTLPFALVVLLVGVVELRRRPDLGSRAAFTPGLVAAFGPSLIIVLAKSDPLREGVLLVAAVATLIYGSMRRQRAPIEVGATVTTITTLHALTLAFSAWAIMIPLGVLALVLGANSERRRRISEGLQKMR
jgi:hypothetical protein